MKPPSRIGRPCVLTIAGSDSGGGAGIQADLKTFQALGCHGMSAITVLTAQNTVTLKSVFPVSPSFLCEQIEVVLQDFGAEAIKLGMLYSPLLIGVVLDCLRRRTDRRTVLDPVMISKTGDRLLQKEAVASLQSLFPLVDVLTPNLEEAQYLAQMNIVSEKDMERAAKRLLEQVPCVVLKGGHLKTGILCRDLFWERGETPLWVENERVETQNDHGTGCTLSSAITAFAARGLKWKEAYLAARKYLQSALESAVNERLCHGRGPLVHDWRALCE